MSDVEVRVVNDANVDVQLRVKIDALLADVFSDVDEQEVKEDFINPKVVHVLVFNGDEVVGWAGLHLSETVYASEKVKLGGFGIGVREDWRRKGVGTQICQAAIKYLGDEEVDVAFLSARPESTRLFEKVGFVPLPGRYSWENIHGEIKMSDEDDGMIAPVNSKELFELVLKGNETLHVGRGYW